MPKNHTNSASADYRIQRLITQYLRLFFLGKDPGWSKWAQTHYPHLGKNERGSTTRDKKLYSSCGNRKDYMKKLVLRRLQGQPREGWSMHIDSILEEFVSPDSFPADETQYSESNQQQSENRTGDDDGANTDATPNRFNMSSLHLSTKHLPDVTIDFDGPQNNLGLFCIKNDQIKMKGEQVSVLTFVKPIVCPKDIQVS
jgi:hypothetical protein